MSRHRDVRNMDYSDDYDGYDDIYGHSVDDEYYISPSHRQFIYNRDVSRDSISECPIEADIQEEPCAMDEDISAFDKARLESCFEQIKELLGPIRTPKSEVTKIILENRFDFEKIVDVLVNLGEGKIPESKKKDETRSLNPGESFLSKIKNKASMEPIENNFLSKINKSSDNSLDFNMEMIKSSTNPGIGNNFLSKINKTKDTNLDFDTEIIKNSPNLSFKPMKSNFLSKIDKNLGDSLDFGTKLIKNNPTISSEYVATNSLSKFKKPLNGDLNFNKSPIRSGNLKNDEHELNYNFLKKLNLNDTNDFSQNFSHFFNTYETNTSIGIKSCKSDNVLKSSTKEQLPQIKSLPILKNWDIDLTSALNEVAITKSKPNVPKETFEIPFVDCNDGIDPGSKHCLLDTKIVMPKRRCRFKKKISAFGKAVCLRYRTKKTRIPKNRFIYQAIAKFDFSYPSPDDKIQAELKRAIDHQI